jgi:hypothetical protein
VAPGVGVRTTYVNGTYTYSTGTSYAAPHVAGAAALLRQYNPNATVEEIKWALMNSAQDLGEAGEDNTYGHGLINIPAALDLVPPVSDPNIFFLAVDYLPLEAGDTADIAVSLKNSGLGTINVSAEIIDSDPSISIVQSFSDFGDLNLGESSFGNNQYRLSFAPDIPNGALLDVDLQISAGGGAYSKLVKLYFRVGEQLVKSSFDHVTDSCQFTITNYGSFGLAPNSIFNDGGVGFRYPASGQNNLFQAGLLIGLDPTHVSDGIINIIGSVDDDFSIAVEGNLEEISPGYLGDIETFSRFCDSNAVHPIGVTVEQRTASCLSADCANYVLLEYTVKNDSPENIEGLYVGLYFDWDFPFGSGAGSWDRTGFARAENLGYMFDTFGDDYRGTAVLNDEGLSTFFAIGNSALIYDGVTEAEKYSFLTAGTSDTASTAAFDQSYSIATGPFDLEPGMSDTVAFAVIGADSLERLKQLARQARNEYRAATPTLQDDEVSLPATFSLEQNFPNPFNPNTEIRYTVARSSRVTIEVYNLLGQQIVTLLDQQMPAGTHAVRWNGKDDRGKSVASGVYLYRLRAGDFSSVKKMLLLK